LNNIGGEQPDSFESRRPSKQRLRVETNTFKSVLAVDMQPVERISNSNTPLHTLFNTKAAHDPMKMLRTPAGVPMARFDEKP
jgi:hypothetical protein